MKMVDEYQDLRDLILDFNRGRKQKRRIDLSFNLGNPIFEKVANFGSIPEDKKQIFAEFLRGFYIWYLDDVQKKENAHTIEVALQEMVNIKEAAHTLAENIDLGSGSPWPIYFYESSYPQYDDIFPVDVPAYNRVVNSSEDGKRISVADRMLFLASELQWLAEHVDVVKEEIASGKQKLSAPPVPNRAEPFNHILTLRIVDFWNEELGRKIIIGKNEDRKQPLVRFADAVFLVISGRNPGYSALQKRLEKAKSEFEGRKKASNR